MQTNAEVQAEVTALRTKLADGSARMSKMNAELVDINARMSKMNADLKSLPKKACIPPTEVIVVQAQATDIAADAVIAYKPPTITYGPWRPDGTRSSFGRHQNGARFKSDGYPPRMLPRKQYGAV
jgi:hypothetical protein